MLIQLIYIHLIVIFKDHHLLLNKIDPETTKLKLVEVQMKCC